MHFELDSRRRRRQSLEQECAYLLQEVVAEGGHQLGRRGTSDGLVTEAFEGLLEGLVEQGAVAEAALHILQVLVVELDHRADVLLLVGT